MGRMLDVFKFWKDKCITEDGEILTEYDDNGYNHEKLNSKNTIPVIEDWGEPSCFACGKTSFDLINRDDYDEMLNSNDFAKQLWNSKEVSRDFDRAHIIPKALGGKDDASNIFCLCSNCHRNSPDTRFSKEFFRWIYQERKLPRQRRIANKVVEICKKENILPLINFKEDINMLKNLNTHGGSVVDSSIIATLVGCARERNEAVIEQHLSNVYV